MDWCFHFKRPLPVYVIGLKNLRHLYLRGNYFLVSFLPSMMDGLSLNILQYLEMNWGNISWELGNLSQLQGFHMGYYNSFNGRIPPKMGKLRNILRLDMLECELLSPIPPEFCNLVNLDTLFLQISKLYNPLLLELGNLKSLKYMYLSNNHLAGEIPEDFSQLKEITLMNIFRNRLDGTVACFIGDLPNLEVLQLCGNNLTGGIPQQLGKNSKHMQVDLSSNKLTRFIPLDLCVGGKLRHLFYLTNFSSIPFLNL